ncbi:DUF2997 domain-containing protein [Rubinisphaera italica]|uniref:DUF2997 domain-containing protein n=1 Tax=Rubinisphaera italica TaxID=2527969 RepID=A0A5C5XCW9_9PLAN|nr:DUF2997 domain-containing protein [Rubinisphaera italica]TWT59762.1 hypothetical protein Pan54_04720 [Rubinisphaera italica]
MKTIQIIISPEGKTVLQTLGFQGSECQAASRFLEQALGSTSSEILTSPFYQHASTSQQQIQTHEPESG